LTRFDDDRGGSLIDEPNSRCGPVQAGKPFFWLIEIHGIVGAREQDKHREDNDFVQAGCLNLVMKEGRARAARGHSGGRLTDVRDQAVQWPALGAVIDRCIACLAKAAKDYDVRVEKAVKTLKTAKKQRRDSWCGNLPGFHCHGSLAAMLTTRAGSAPRSTA
jgi:hypothetical protein